LIHSSLLLSPLSLLVIPISICSSPALFHTPSPLRLPRATLLPLLLLLLLLLLLFNTTLLSLTIIPEPRFDPPPLKVPPMSVHNGEHPSPLHHTHTEDGFWATSPEQLPKTEYPFNEVNEDENASGLSYDDIDSDTYLNESTWESLLYSPIDYPCPASTNGASDDTNSQKTGVRWKTLRKPAAMTLKEQEKVDPFYQARF